MPVVGIWPGHRGYTPTLYKKCHEIFNDHRESGPRFNVSSGINTQHTLCMSSRNLTNENIVCCHHGRKSLVPGRFSSVLLCFGPTVFHYNWLL